MVLDKPINNPTLQPSHAIATTPPPEVLAQEFTMDVPLHAISDQKIVPPDDAIVVKDKVEKPVELGKEKKEEVKVPDTKDKPVLEKDKKEETKPVASDPKTEEPLKKEKKPLGLPDTKATPDAFDYTGYSPDETNKLKNMSREAREWAGKIAKENRELVKLKDYTYLQHPNAYILNPEFQELHRTTEFANSEAAAWAEQLENIKSGKEWTSITGRNKDGSFIYSAPKPATNRDEEQVRLWMNKCLQVAQANGDKVRAYPERFKAQVSADINTINETRKQMFGWVADPKMLEQTIDDPEGRGAVKISDYRKELISMFPIYLQSSPLMDTFADTYAAMKIQARMIINAEAGNKVEEIKEEEKGATEPRSKVKPSKQEEGINGSPATFDLVGMPT